MGALALVKYHYSYYHFTFSVRVKPASQQAFFIKKKVLWKIDLCGKQSDGGEFGWCVTSVK